MVAHNTSAPLEPECEELNAEVSWTEVYAALEQAGTSKAPGLDGLPNEVLRVCRGPPTALEAPNPMAEALLEQCRAMLEGQVSPEINTSVLVPVDKPGKDAQEVDNRRGISLMSTLLKLVTKIASNRIQEHVPAVSKEQAGFRPGRSASRTWRLCMTCATCDATIGASPPTWPLWT